MCGEPRGLGTRCRKLGSDTRDLAPLEAVFQVGEGLQRRQEGRKVLVVVVVLSLSSSSSLSLQSWFMD